MRGNYWLVEKFKILKCCAPWSLISGWLLDWLIVWLFLQSVSQSERRSRTLFAFSTAVTSSGRKMKVFVMLPSCTNYKRSCKKIIMYSLLSDNRRVFWITSQNQTSRISGTEHRKSRLGILWCPQKILHYFTEISLDCPCKQWHSRSTRHYRKLRSVYVASPIAATAWHCGATRSLVLRFRIPPGHGSLSLWVSCDCQVEVSASGWTLVQRSPTECGVSNRDRDGSLMRRPWPTGAVAPCCSWPNLLL